MELRRHGLPLRLQEQPLRVLVFLATRAGELVTREELRGLVWGDTFVDFDQSLNKAINRAREALRDDPATPQYIETVPRRGYRFIAPVTVIAAIEAHAAGDQSATLTGRRDRVVCPCATERQYGGKTDRFAGSLLDNPPGLRGSYADLAAKRENHSAGSPTSGFIRLATHPLAGWKTGGLPVRQGARPISYLGKANRWG